MKPSSRSALNRRTATFLCSLFLLAACADVKGVNWLTGEPGEEVTAASRPVGPPPNAVKKEGWPRLGEVPSRRPDFSTQAQRDEQAVFLAAERDQAKAEKERIRNVPVDGKTMPLQEPLAEEAKPFSYSTLMP